jgi:hypothetical protein
MNGPRNLLNGWTQNDRYRKPLYRYVASYHHGPGRRVEGWSVK